MAAGYEYHVESVWAGWLFGGWDSESQIEDILNRLAGEGWRLISTQSQHFAWWPPFIRPKLLLVFERRAE
jgi:hypothetical protein